MVDPFPMNIPFLLRRNTNLCQYGTNASVCLGIVLKVIISQRNNRATRNLVTTCQLISNFRRVLDVVCFLLGDSPASEFLYADVLEHPVPSS